MPNPIRTTSYPIGPIPGYQGGINIPELPEVDVSIIAGGMNTKLDTTDIEEGQVVLAKNVVIRNDRPTRRYGSVLLTPTKPNSNKVLDFKTTQQFNKTISQLRFDKSKIYKRLVGSWSEITGAGFTGSDTDRWTLVEINDNFYASNNGIDVPIDIDLGAGTYTNLVSPSLVNAPKHKYWCGFYGRLVGAYKTSGGDNPILVSWSGDDNFGEFDGTIDISAGFEPLIESQSNYMDFITGLFGFADKMIILRERTIWLAIKQPSATSPFLFYTAVPNVGCDCPYTAQQTDDGIVWYDNRTHTVYRYGVNDNAPTPIGRPIEDDIVITDPTTLFSSWDPINFEYTLGIPIPSSSVVRLWTHSFKTNAWWYSEINNVSCVSALSYSSSTFAIADLVGSIGSLMGTIASLSPSVDNTTKFYGITDGSILQESNDATDDNGVLFTSDIISKTYEYGGIDFYVPKIEFVIECFHSGQFLIEISRDNGNTFNIQKYITIEPADVGTRKFIRLTKNIKARNYVWRIVGNDGLWSLNRFTFQPIPAGNSKRRLPTSTFTFRYNSQVIYNGAITYGS